MFVRNLTSSPGVSQVWIPLDLQSESDRDGEGLKSTLNGKKKLRHFLGDTCFLFQAG